MFIDEHRKVYGGEPICRVLTIASSTYYSHVARRERPEARSSRANEDASLRNHIRKRWDENHQVYGGRKVWKQLSREGIKTARCTVQRLMREMGLRGAVRGRRIKTTISKPGSPCPRDRVKRVFRADRPDALWVSDFTYVWTAQGFVYVALVIDVFSRRIVGWRVSTRATTDFVLDALEQALHERKPAAEDNLIHHSDRGVQYLSIHYTQRLFDAGLQPSVGSVGDSYDNAMAESIIGLYKTEVILRQSWKNASAVELATLVWVDWFNNRRLLGPIGHIPPVEAEAAYYERQNATAVSA